MPKMPKLPKMPKIKDGNHFKKGIMSILSPSLNPSDSTELVAGRQGREAKFHLFGALYITGFNYLIFKFVILNFGHCNLFAI